MGWDASSLWLRVKIVPTCSNNREGEMPTFYVSIRKVIFAPTAPPAEINDQIYYFYFLFLLNRKVPTDCKNSCHHSTSPPPKDTFSFHVQCTTPTIGSDERLKSYTLSSSFLGEPLPSSPVGL